MFDTYTTNCCICETETEGLEAICEDCQDTDLETILGNAFGEED